MALNLRDANVADIPRLAELHLQTFNETHRGDDRADRHTNYGKLNGAKPSAGKTVAGFLLSSKTTMAS